MIHYVTGDATEMLFGDPKANKILAHISNNKSGWGGGITGVISKRWTLPEKTYRYINPLALGTNQLVEVEQGKYVCNMVAQDGFSTKDYAACNLEALGDCFYLLSHTISLAKNIEVHGPRWGCGLGGRIWEEVEPMVQRYLKCDNIYVYDLPSK